MDTAKVSVLVSYAVTKGQTNGGTRLEVLQGTLDLMVLQTLDSSSAFRIGHSADQQDESFRDR